MLNIQLGLSAVSVILYLLFNGSGWLKQARGSRANDASRRAYFAGLLFAGLFYYGFPIWWGRYGLARTGKLLLACIGAGAVVQALLRTLGAIEVKDFSESFALGMLIAVPIRAIAGTWVAKLDSQWRGAIVAQRRMQSQAMKQ